MTLLPNPNFVPLGKLSKVPREEIVPHAEESQWMFLKPNEEKKYYGRFIPTFHKGFGMICHPLGDFIEIKKGMIDTAIFTLKAGPTGLEFSLYRPDLEELHKIR